MDECIEFQHRAVTDALHREIEHSRQQIDACEQLLRQIAVQSSLSHVGCDVFVPSDRDRSQKILINLGVGIFVEMGDAEVVEYTNRRKQELQLQLDENQHELAEILELQRALFEAT